MEGCKTVPASPDRTCKERLVWLREKVVAVESAATQLQTKCSPALLSVDGRGKRLMGEQGWEGLS